MNFFPSAPELKETSRIEINIWLPKLKGQTVSAECFVAAHALKKTDETTDRIGHVSVKTPQYYASWWPNYTNADQVGAFSRIAAQNSTYEADRSAEGNRDPDIKTCLYSLDIEAVDNHLQHQ